MEKEFTPEEQRRLAVINRAQEYFGSLEQAIKWGKKPNPYLDNETPFYVSREGIEGLARVLSILEMMERLADELIIS